jgi:hypothetical protein
MVFFACKSSPTEPETPPSNKFYDITVVTVNIFDDSEAGGAVILNGERKDSGGTFKIENGKIDSIFVEVPGFNPDYIFCRSEAGETILTRDASGLNCPALTTDITLYFKLIPSDFNVRLLAKCLGGDQYDGDPDILGDGTVQRYLGSHINVGITEGDAYPQTPTNETINNLKDAVASVNDAAQGIFLLDYLGGAGMWEGLVYAVSNWVPPLFHARIQEHAIYNSGFQMRYDATPKMVLEGVVRSLGIRRNGGGENYPYISDNPTSPTFISDGERALQLIYLLPPGFKLDPN